MHIHGIDYEVEVRVALYFHASHALPTRPELHEHRWEVEFSVAGPLDPATGMVIDMLILADFFKPYTEPFDQTNLHEFPEFQGAEGFIGVAGTYPTCDTLAHYFLWKTIPEFKANPQFKDLRISQVKVSIFEPEGSEPWGHAIIRPKSTR